jgi:Spy/CpxP family protein refolding chaperone
MNRIALSLMLTVLGLPSTAVSQGDPAEFSVFQEQMLETATRLDLSEAQRAELEPLLLDHFEKTRRLLERHGLDEPYESRPGRRQMLALSRDLRPLRERMDREVAAILSEEQMTEFREIQEERRDQMRARFQGQQR